MPRRTHSCPHAWLPDIAPTYRCTRCEAEGRRLTPSEAARLGVAPGIVAYSDRAGRRKGWERFEAAVRAVFRDGRRRFTPPRERDSTVPVDRVIR